MRMKTFLADTMQEAMQKVKEDLGSEAVILKTRQVKGSMGLGKEQFEITAALEDRHFAEPETAKPSDVSGSTAEPKSKIDVYNWKRVRENLNAQANESKAVPANSMSIHETPVSNTAMQIRNLDEIMAHLQKPFQEIEKMRGGLVELTSRMGQLQNSIEELDLDGLDEWGMQWVRALGDVGIENSLCKELVRKVQYLIPIHKRAQVDAVWAKLSKIIQNRMVIAEGWKSKPGRPLVVMVGGLPGVGKTHLVTSLALYYKQKENKHCAILNMDHGKLGSAGALDAFSRATGILCQDAYTSDEAMQMMQSWVGMDIIFLDMPGSWQGDVEGWAEMSGMIRTIEPDKKILVLDATTRHGDLLDTCKSYRSLGFGEIAFSKTDLSKSLGCLYNMAVRAEMPLSWLSPGRGQSGEVKWPVPNQMVARMFPELPVLTDELAVA